MLDGELAPEAAKDLADFHEHGLGRRGGAIVMVGGGLGVPWSYFSQGTAAALDGTACRFRTMPPSPP